MAYCILYRVYNVLIKKESQMNFLIKSSLEWGLFLVYYKVDEQIVRAIFAHKF